MSNKKSMRIYRLIDYPKPGYEYGNFKAQYPYQAGHKIINFLNVSSENEHSMVKFWMREYIPVENNFIKLMNYINKKLLILNDIEIKNILILFYINLLKNKKYINKKNIINIDIKKHIDLIKQLPKKKLINLIGILLINFYKETKFQDNIYDKDILDGKIINGNYIRNAKTNIKNKYKLENINLLLSANLKKLNNNVDKNKNIHNILLNNSGNIKLPKIFKKLLVKIYTDYDNKHKYIERLHKNLKF